MRATWYRLAVLGIAGSVLASACAVSGLSFVADTRVKIHEPEENEKVTVPFTVDWTVDDYDGLFVVFFDRSPMRPGQDLRSLVPEGDPCRVEPNCPDAAWLADRNIYVTDANTLVIEALPDRRDTNRAKDRHDLTIVLLDRDGRRSGESAFTKEFIVERER
jgi:hypothetical protein